MPIIRTKDGTEIFYKDWGSGQPIVFSHGWPLSADDWDTQLLFFMQHGYRVIAHDRRGHGRSTQTGDGHDMDHYADDLAAVTEYLNLQNAIHIGHSTGGGEVTHYLGRHGEKPREQGSFDQRGAAADVENGGQSSGPSEVRLRRSAGAACCQSVEILYGCSRPVLFTTSTGQAQSHLS